MKRFSAFLTTLALTFSSAQAQVTVTLDFAAENGAQLHELSDDVTFSTTDSGTSTGIGTVLDGITSNETTVTLSDAGFTGVYQISVDVLNLGPDGVPGVGIERGGTGTLGTLTGNVLLDAGQTLTFDNVVLTHVSGDNVFQFDGFTGVFIGNLGNSEVATIQDGNGNTLVSIANGETGEGGGNLFGPTRTFDNDVVSKVIVYSGTGTTINVVDARFSLVPPEPQVVLSTAATAPVAGDFTVNAVFNENVNGLELGDFDVTNGTASALTPDSGPASSYSVMITPSASGTVQVELPAEAAVGSNGFDSLASNVLSISAVLEPMVELSTTATEPVSGDYTVDIAFNEDVTGLDATDFIVTNGTATSASPLAGSASSYTVIITPTASGDVTVELPEAAAQDGGGFDSLASNVLTTFAVLPGDEQATVTLSTMAAQPVFGGTYLIDVLFSEDVEGLGAGDFTIDNGTITEIDPAEGPARSYTVTVDPVATGDVTVTLIGAGVTDVDDTLPSTDSNTLVTDYFDPSIPTVTFTTPFADGLVTSAPFTVSVSFSENVSGLELSDFVVTNGVASDLNSSNASNYSLVITPTATGAITVELPAGSVTDTDGESQGNLRALVATNNLASGTFSTPLIDLAGRDNAGLADGESAGFFTSPKTFDSVSDLSLNDIPWTDGENSGTFDLSFVATGSLEFIARTGRGGFGTALNTNGVGLVGAGETVTLGSFVASDLQGDLAGQSISNIEVIGVYLGNFGGTDTSTINGIEAIGTGSGLALEDQRNNIPASSVVEVAGTGSNGGSINGIAISFQVGGIPQRITNFTFDPDTNQASLTWTSIPNVVYSIRYSFDLKGFEPDIADSIPGSPGDETTFPFTLPNDLIGRPRIFFRVED